MKTCFKCHETKPLDEFYRHAQMADGHLNKCKACAKLDVAQHREKNIDEIRAYDRERGRAPARLAENVERIREYRRAHPDRARAHHVLGRAVRTGRIVPWPVCAVPECDVTRVEAHHADYSEPLLVVWLCSVHHKACHYSKGRTQ